ncbi:MAG: hypothetical protein QM741_01645 [Rudaea sp.]
MIAALLCSGLAGRNEADGFVFENDVDDEQQATGRRIVADHGIAGLVVATGVHQPEERTKNTAAACSKAMPS